MKKTLLLLITVLVCVQAGIAQGAIDVSIIKTGTATDEDDPTITFDASSDDAEQENNEIDALFDDDIDAGWEGDEGDANILTAGLRFQNLTIPKGAKIDSAFFVFVSHEAKSAQDVANLTIYAEDTDSASTFTEDALITDRVSTSATVSWIVDEEWGLWTTERSVDISVVVQEIVDRDGWEPGNAIAFVIAGEDQGPSEVENAREWQSFENIADPEDGGDGRNYPRRAPRLIVYFDGYEGEPIEIDRGINSFARDALDISIVKTGTTTDEDDPTITFDASSDDAEQENDEIDALFDDDIDAGWEGEEGDANVLTAGLRFQKVGVPQGATIDSAFFVVVSHEAKSAADVARLTIYAEDTDNAETFTEDALITDRVSTTAQVEWTVDEEWGLWTTERSVDISPVVQEIVNREGWVSGNDMAFILAGEDQGPSEVENAREWQSFENIADPEDGGNGRNYPERAPRLIIYYGGYDGEPLEIDRGINSFSRGAVDVSIVKTGTATDEDDPTITFDASSDDAEQENDEIDALFDDDIDAGWEGEEGDANVLTAGLRFQDVQLPQFARIDSAFFVVVSHEAKSAADVARLTIYAEATDDATTFTEDALLTDRVSTEAQVSWVVDEDWGLWTTETSVDISPIVQELVNREGWSSGNSMAFIVAGEDQGPSEVENAREWQSFENIADPGDGGDGQNYPERAPRLVVYYGGYDGEPIVIDRGINSFAALSVADDPGIVAEIYPNPAVSHLNLILPSSNEASITLANMEGKIIREFSNNGLKEIKINLAYFDEGIYLISVEQDGATLNKRFIIK